MDLEFGGNSNLITSGGGSEGGTCTTSGLDGVAGSSVGTGCSSTAALRRLNLWRFPLVRGQAAGFWRRQGPGASSSHSFAASHGKVPGCAEVRSSQGFSSIPRKRAASAHQANLRRKGKGSCNGTYGIGSFAPTLQWPFGSPPPLC